MIIKKAMIQRPIEKFLYKNILPPFDAKYNVMLFYEIKKMLEIHSTSFYIRLCLL
jgi:hypothetical protein